MADAPTILIWFWGRRGGGPAVTRLLVDHLLEAGLAGRLAVSLSAQNEQLPATAACDGLELHVVETFEGASFGGLAGRLPALRREFRRLLERLRPDVIVAPMVFAALPFLLDIAQAQGRRLIYGAHDARPHPGDPGGGRIALAQALAIRAADEVIAFSRFSAQALRRRHPRAAEKISVEPLAALYRLRRTPRPAPPGPLRFLAPGRLVRYKGFERLAAAISAAPVTLTIAGDGPERARVQALFGGTPNVCLLLDWLAPERQAALFDEHDVLLCPYDEASQSGTICDALAAAMPIIVTPVGALPEQVGFGRAGRVLSDGSPQTLAATLKRNLPDYAALSTGCQEILDRARRGGGWAERLS